MPKGLVSQPQVLHHDSQEDHGWPTTLHSQPRETPSSLCSKELDDPDSLPPCPTGLWRTVSFYNSCLDGTKLHGHTLFATPDENEDHHPAGEDNYNEPPIDEASPSNNDCLAESILRGENVHTHPKNQARPPSHGEYPGHANNNAEDVVAAHQQHNHAACLPNNSQLNAIREWRSSTLHQVSQAQSMTSLPSGMSQLLEAVNPPVPPVASVNAFLLCPHFNTKVVEYVEEAISERLSCGLLVSNGWWPHYMNAIGKLTSVAALGGPRQLTFVIEEEGLHNCCKVNSGITKELLGDCGVFLRDGVDEYGHTNNLAHPALAGLIINFFYMGSLSLGQLFLEVFRMEVLRVTVAIVATVLRVILNEVVSPQGRQQYDGT
ncbi:hypothetical protein BKA83DRAFT_4126665 [Pisolithus microcarpus]|nr:hypothetical protein BKA83DRAFT_4126665 [Pisolithus microcarpus]